MKKRPLCFVCLIFLIIRSFIIVMNSGQLFEKMPADSVFLDGKEKEVLIQGQVYKKTDTSKNQVLYLKNSSIYSQKQSFYESKIMIYDKTFQKIEIGKIVKLKGKTAFFDKARNPGNFNQRHYYYRQRIYGFVWCEEILEVSGQPYGFRNKLHDLKKEWKEMLLEVMGEKNGNIMSAVLLSEKGDMDADVKELYQKNGIGHILAISGLHISFIGLSVYQLLRKTGCPYLTAGIGACLFLGSYVLMIGFSISVIRACIMLFIRIGADMIGRVYDMATALCLAGAITVLWQPLCLTDAGFLMSYGAVLGILIVLPAMEKLFPCKSKILKGFYASVSINLMLLPVLLYFYFEFPTYSLFINMIVIPMMPWVLGLGLAGGICFFIWRPAAVFLLQECRLLLECIEMLSRFGSRLPGAKIVFGRPSGLQIVIYYVILLAGIVVIHRYEKEKLEKEVRRWSVVVFGTLFFMFWLGHGKAAGSIGVSDVLVTIIDVGQGDGIFLQGPKGSTYLIDGGSSDVEQVGKYRIEPFLKFRGVGKLDYVFISHGDADHYNGVEEMIERQDVGVRIENLVLPVNYKEEKELYHLAALAKENGISVFVMKDGMTLEEGSMRITCIQPSEAEENLTGNAGSMVLDVAFGNFDMLCTGDVEGEGEEKLIENLAGRKYDVLKVAHHGSKNSTNEQFLACVQPKIALISAGIENRYGHPHEETLEKLKESGAVIYNTQEDGAVMIRTDGKQIIWDKINSKISY